LLHPLDHWKYWDAISVPMLVLHGAKSDLLSRELTQEMRKRNRRASVFQFDDCGHVPPLMVKEQIDIVVKFISEGSGISEEKNDPSNRAPASGRAI
jgi:pimeloyl-ACP methyl ester carboxylesterase